MPHAAPYFSSATFDFLRQLRQNNNRPWFHAHKPDYEALVREPALALITDLQPVLAKISSHMVAMPKKVGGSLFQVARDARKKPSEPYKPWIGLRFYHAQRNQVHAPSFFVHIDPETNNSFMGGGLWRPEPPTLKRLRNFLDENPRSWQTATASKALQRYEDDGEWLTRVPRGYPANHPLEADLRRKSFVWTRPLPLVQAESAELPRILGKTFREVAPVMDYLCAALDLPF